ncbi:MAG: AI-2E family transporter, partial [Treponema sp.]|nr:AI-2E family transporter [Treponema sp.]
MEEKTSKSNRRIFMVLLLIAFIVIAAVLKLTKSFAIPITVSVLLAFVLYPLCLKLNRLHIPWVLCIIIMLVLGTFLFILVSTVLVSSISSVVKVYPSYEYKFNALSEKITQIYKQFCETMNIEYDEQTSIWRTLSNSLNINLKSALLNVYSVGTSVLSVLKTILILVLFLVFLLIELNPKNSSSKIDAAF